jgi:glycine betaine/proline transport system ATP-binding protein
MKDGVIEQCDTPANIVLHPATDYVAKFTNDVPRERVLTCKNVMEEVGNTIEFSDIRVPHNAIIEKIAEVVLNESKSVAVVDDNDNMIGVLHRKSIIHVLFGRGEPAPLSVTKTTGK